jgi:hypothetical protein
MKQVFKHENTEYVSRNEDMENVGMRKCKMLVGMRTWNKLVRMRRTWNMLVGRWMMETDSSHKGDESLGYTAC